MRRNRSIALITTGLAVGGFLCATGCQVDEVTVGVGNARTEDSFGNPMVRPFDPDESLRLYRHKIERKKPENDDQPETGDATDPEN